MNFRCFTRSADLLFLALFLFFGSGLAAETVYMNDGQILNGKIIKEDDEAVTIETRFQTRSIEKKYITKIVYNIELEPVQIVTTGNDLIKGLLVLKDSVKVVYKIEKDSEEISIPRDKVKSITIGTPPSDKINILTDDGKIISGELIYQDKNRVIVRSEDEPENEITIDKDDIARISYDAIRIYDSEVLFLPGLGIPLDSGGAELGIAPAVFIGYLINNPYINNTKFLFEGGYCNPKSKSDDKANLQIISASANLAYVYPLKYFNLIPRAGLGGSILYYRNLRGDSFFGIKPAVTAGIGGSYAIIENRLFLMSFLNYGMIFDGGARLSSLFITAGVSYRLFK